MTKEHRAKQYLLLFGLTLIAAVLLQDAGIKLGAMLETDQPTVPVVPVAAEDTGDAFCSLAAVDCAGAQEAGKKTVYATITTYQAVAAQTDSTPCQGAMAGINFCNPPYPIVAANGWKLGTKVRIRGVVYVVADRMNSRYGSDRFDILTQGKNWTWTQEPVTVL